MNSLIYAWPESTFLSIKIILNIDIYQYLWQKLTLVYVHKDTLSLSKYLKHTQNFVFTLLRVAQRLCAVLSLILVVEGNRWFSGEPCLMHNTWSDTGAAGINNLSFRLY